MTTIIERYVEPLSNGTRGQLHQAVFVDGEQVMELCHPLGSPAPIASVRERAEVLTVTATGVERRTA